MDTSICNSSYRLRYWNFFSTFLLFRFCNTGCNSAYRLRYWNATWEIYLRFNFLLLQQRLPFTVLKLHLSNALIKLICSYRLQQRLPFTVLKHCFFMIILLLLFKVATALTVYGIETNWMAASLPANFLYVATALTVYGIETSMEWHLKLLPVHSVATALTVYGIETLCCGVDHSWWYPVATALTVYGIETCTRGKDQPRQPPLQQRLPFTVLKL